VPARVIGKVAIADAGLQIRGTTTPLTLSTARMLEAYHEALPKAMARAAGGGL